MKMFSAVMKVLAAIAAVVGVVYVAATYGDKIVAWAKKLLPKCPCCEAEGECTCGQEDVPEEPAAEDPAVEAPQEAPAEEAPVADEADFEG